MSGEFWWVLVGFGGFSSSQDSGRGPEDRIKTTGVRGEFIYICIYNVYVID